MDTPTPAPVAPAAPASEENVSATSPIAPELHAKVAALSAEECAAFDLPARLARLRKRREGDAQDLPRYGAGQDRIIWAFFDTMLTTLETMARQADLANDANVLEAECGKQCSIISSLCDCFYSSFQEMAVWPEPGTILRNGDASDSAARVFAIALFGPQVFGPKRLDDEANSAATDAFALARVLLACDVGDFEDTPTRIRRVHAAPGGGDCRRPNAARRAGDCRANRTRKGRCGDEGVKRGRTGRRRQWLKGQQHRQRGMSRRAHPQSLSALFLVSPRQTRLQTRP